MNAPPRSLAKSPASFLDPKTRGPAFGSYAGPLPRIGMPSLGLRDRIARRKKWFYLAVSSGEIWVSLAVVRTGYAATAFGFAYDLAARTMLVDRTVLGLPLAAQVADGPHEPGAIARFALGRSSVVFARAGERIDVRARLGELEVEAAIDETAAPTAVSAIARLGDGLVNATEKRVLAKASGHVRAGGRSFDLSGATAGWDYTHGLLPRHTRWRWAFALGTSAAGAPLGFNLVSGFVGQAECAAFFGGELHPLAEPRFELDVAHPSAPWTLRGDGVDLTFEPGAVHAQHTNLGIIRSRFVQPVGTFRGTLRIAGRDVEVRGLPGVVEDQDVLW